MCAFWSVSDLLKLMVKPVTEVLQKYLSEPLGICEGLRNDDMWRVYIGQWVTR